MEVKLKEGRLFNKDSDTDYDESIIVNEEYVKRFDIDEPIGKMVNLVDDKRYIVGVVEDIIRDIWSDGKTVPEVYIPVREEEYNMLVVKAKSKNKQEVFNFLAETWKSIIPGQTIYRQVSK